MKILLVGNEIEKDTMIKVLKKVEAQMNVKEIVSRYLSDNGFDGLFNDGGECGCLLDDLCPCDGEIGNCEPGYKLPGDEEFDFLVGPEKEEKNGNDQGLY